jgi:hypothetical protein
LEAKLDAFRDYYHGCRGHAGLKGETPVAPAESRGANLKSYHWQQHCGGSIKHQWRRKYEFAINRIGFADETDFGPIFVCRDLDRWLDESASAACHRIFDRGETAAAVAQFERLSEIADHYDKSIPTATE